MTFNPPPISDKSRKIIIFGIFIAEASTFVDSLFPPRKNKYFDSAAINGLFRGFVFTLCPPFCNVGNFQNKIRDENVMKVVLGDFQLLKNEFRSQKSLRIQTETFINNEFPLEKLVPTQNFPIFSFLCFYSTPP